MPPASRDVWTDADFDALAWHDVHVHGVTVGQGASGAGELSLDLDYILEWLCDPDGTCRFRLVPAALTFLEVTNLRIEIDWGARQALVGPFSIDRIVREPHPQPPGRRDVRWTIALNWPQGAITFDALGFEQRRRGPEVVSDEQVLTTAQRSVEPGGV